MRRFLDTSSIASGLAGLAEAAGSLKEGLAFTMLDEAVAAANSNNVGESELGRLAIETGVFGVFAAKNEPRVLQSAEALKERSARMAASATIYQRRVKALIKDGAGAPAS